MFSLKDAVRKTILTVSLAAVTTSFFVGCNNNQPVSSNDLYPPTIEATIEAPPSLTDDIDPTTPDANNFSIKFKYWYDNPDVQEAQSQIPNPGGDDNGDTFLDLAGLPIYTDPDGNQYIISGRTPVYLKDGKIPEKDMFQNFRTEGAGERIYVGLIESTTKSAEKFAEMLKEINRQQPETYDERVAAPDTGKIVDEQEYAVYVNNTDTGMIFSSSVKYIDISSLLEAYSLGLTKTDSSENADVSLYTAAGELIVSFSINGEECTVSYSTDIKSQTIDSDEIIINGNKVFLTLAVIEDYLGYDIEYYDNFINIVTDNKDIIKPENVVSGNALSSADNTLNNNDSTKPADDPENVKAQEELEEQRKKEEGDAERQAVADLAGKDVDELTQKDYDALGIIPPGEDPETYKPATDADGKTAAERHQEAMAEADEEIQNGDPGWDDEDLEDSKNYMVEWMKEQGYSEEEIAAFLAKE